MKEAAARSLSGCSAAGYEGRALGKARSERIGKMINWRLNLRRAPVALAALGLAIALGACGPSFSQVALNNASSLKDKSATTLANATLPYVDHKDEVETLRRELDNACEQAKKQSRNDASIQQWELMRNPDGHLLGGALKRWQTEGKLSPAFVTEV